MTPETTKVLPEKVYLPDNSVRRGYASIISEIARELWANRWLTYQLFVRDITATYKQSFLGIFWVFILPIFSVMTFVVLSRETSTFANFWRSVRS